MKEPAPKTSGVVDSARKLEHKIEHALIVLWDELPHWMQDNHFIRSGYRAPSGSFARSFASLGYLHNESVNIYTHLIGAIFFSIAGCVLYDTLKPRYASADASDVFACGCFFAGAALCLGMSATYHTISNHSPIVARLGNKLDYVGIVCLITGSFIPSVYYGFFCDSKQRELYWTMICTLGACCGCMTVLDRFRTPQWRPFRAGMFVGMGLSAVFPVLHGWGKFGYAGMQTRIGLDWLLMEGFFYILGAGLYAVSEHLDVANVRRAGLSDPRRDPSTYGAAHTRSSMCWSWLPPDAT